MPISHGSSAPWRSSWWSFFLAFGCCRRTAWSNASAGRSSFLVGAPFSATTGYLGMWLAIRGNVRVAAAARSATPEPGGPPARSHRGPAPGDADRLPHRRRGRTGHGRPRAAGRGGRRAVVRGRGPEGPAGLRFRGGPAGDVHARRRRHLHQGGRCRRRPGRQGRAGHPRGRPAQRGRPSRTTSATTWGTAQAWLPTSSSPTPSPWSPR